MGINKSNVRFILHYNLPESLEHYYQEIGRAGRDGLRADCLLLYSRGNTVIRSQLIDRGASTERAGRQARLQAMLRYAQTEACRREPLLNYFGEQPNHATCGFCDNCLAAKTEVEKVDATAAARKFLSCVVRTGHMFGVTLSTVVQHLARCIWAGQRFAPERIQSLSALTPEDQTRVVAAFATHGTERLRPIFEALEEVIPHDELHIMRMLALCPGDVTSKAASGSAECEMNGAPC